MASEEERAKILAEYKAAAAADDDDNEAEFNPAFYDSENDDEFTGDESSDEEEAVVDPVVLNVTLHINDEGRIIISGTWCLQSQLAAESQDLMCSKPVKKHPKFKLKSQDGVYGTLDFRSFFVIGQSSNGKKSSRRSVCLIFIVLHYPNFHLLIAMITVAYLLVVQCASMDSSYNHHLPQKLIRRRLIIPISSRLQNNRTRRLRSEKLNSVLPPMEVMMPQHIIMCWEGV